MDNKLRDYLSSTIKWDRYVRINAVSMIIVDASTG
jgi:hypothetical protein